MLDNLEIILITNPANCPPCRVIDGYLNTEENKGIKKLINIIDLRYNELTEDVKKYVTRSSIPQLLVCNKSSVNKMCDTLLGSAPIIDYIKKLKNKINN